MRSSFVDVVVTGVGPILPGCDSRETMWRQLREGESQLSFEADPAAPGETCPMGRLRGFDPAKYLDEIPERFYARYHRELQIYLASLYLAKRDASLGDLRSVPGDKIGLFDGSSRTNLEHWCELIHREASAPLAEVYTRRELVTAMPASTVGVAASLLKVRGPAFAFNATCSSGAVAIGHAFREIASGEIDLAFATGHDCALVAPIYAMYRDANLLSGERDQAERSVRPFVEHSANVFGEGAVTLVLESRAHAEERGAPILAKLSGFRYGNNGYHPTTVDVSGLRPFEIMRAMLQSEKLPTDAVDFVVGHGNAVHLSDVSEENYMRLVFGARASEVPLISTKPIYGHTLGGSSAINAAAAVLMLHHGFVIPTINVDAGRVKRVANHQANVGVSRACQTGFAISYGMGGHNAALLFRKHASTP